jgi:hypothetical protein
MTLKTWVRGGRIAELHGQQGRRIAGESKFIFSKQAYGYARVVLGAGLAYRTRRLRTSREVSGPGEITT